MFLCLAHFKKNLFSVKPNAEPKKHTKPNVSWEEMRFFLNSYSDFKKMMA